MASLAHTVEIQPGWGIIESAAGGDVVWTMVVTTESKSNEEAGIYASLPWEAIANSVVSTLRVTDERETSWILSRVILGYVRR